MSSAIVPLMDTESDMLNALNIGADDGRKIANGMVMGMDEKTLSLYVADIIVSLGFCTFMWLMFFFVKTIADNEMEEK